MLGVVRYLNRASAIGLIDCAFHRAGDSVCIQNHPALYVAHSSADSLDQTCLATQEALFVCIKYVLKSSAIFLVNVVAITLKPFAITFSASRIRSGICSRHGFTTSSGSIKPVGRIICSVTLPFSNSYLPGVADV